MRAAISSELILEGEANTASPFCGNSHVTPKDGGGGGAVGRKRSTAGAPTQILGFATSTTQQPGRSHQRFKGAPVGRREVIAGLSGRILTRLTCIIAAGFLALSAFSSSALAQPAPAEAGPIAPMFSWSDANGVSLASRSISIPWPGISIGDPKAGGLSFLPNFNLGGGSGTWGGNFFGRSTIGDICATCGWDPSHPKVVTFEIDGVGDKFIYWPTSGTFTPLSPNGGSPGVYTGPDGTRYYFENGEDVSPFQFRISRGEKLDGEVIWWHYRTYSETLLEEPWVQTHQRLQSITNNLGYQIHFEYASNTDSGYVTGIQAWEQLVRVVGIDNSVYYCAPLADSCLINGGGVNWPYLQYQTQFSYGSGFTFSITDALGRTSTVVRDPYDAVYHVRSPASPADDTLIQITYSGDGTVVLAATLTNAAGTWAYTFGTSSTSVTGPNGYSRQVTFAEAPSTSLYASLKAQYGFNDSGDVPPDAIAERFVGTDTVNGRTTSYEYDDYLRIRKVTYFDGRVDEYFFNAHGAVERVRRAPKPGSGLADINTYATYPEPSAAMCSNAKTCNKPLTVTDARGNVSTFTYDSNHGGLLTATRAAPGSGPFASIQPQVRNTYGDAGTGIIRITSTSTCRTTSSCAGSGDETVVDTTYNAKRVPSLITTRAGDWSAYAQVSFTYTPQGDVATVDGPLAGTTDTTYGYYNDMRQKRAVVTPDPDGGGSRLYGVTRTTYNADGNPVTIDKGEVGSPASWDSLSPAARATLEYDSFGRKVRENTINLATSSPETVVQTSYDSAGRVECVAQRMNPLAYGSLPGACSQSTAGPDGPDRIVRTTYDTNGDPLVIQSGYGTPLVRNERTMTYLMPGQVGTLKDAANNLTTLEYDGFNRLTKTRYPVTTAGGNASSTSDYEEVAYDAAGNVTFERRREPSNPSIAITVTNTYDNLNRARTKDFSDVTPDVTNSYDNLDHLVAAGSSVGTISWGYDALGRVTSEGQPNGTVSYGYDAAGRRTLLTYPGGGFAVTYQYHDDGALQLIGLNGTGDVLATYYYDMLHRRASICRSAGTSSSCSGGARTQYGYDAISRLAGLSHDLVTGASTYDLSNGFTYNPASQLTSRTATNSLYEWPYTGAFNDGYSVNGLNQYTTVAGQGLAYDGRGNTTNDTTKAYDYDAMNRLKSSNNGASAVYDATGRLLSISQGGTTTRFLYDGTRLIAEYDQAGTLQRRYVHGPGVDDPMVWFQYPAGTRHHLFKDERGSVIAADTGSAVTTMRYDEYGNHDAGATYSGRFQYTGQTWMAELGLYYYKARAYNPDLGRFMQTDPIGTKDQVNLYAYVGNDPMSKVDPTGKECQNSDGRTRCVSPNYDVAFKTPEGFQNTDTSRKDYHEYTTLSRSQLDEKQTRDYVRDKPTPGLSKDATPEGTNNDATPVIGGEVPVSVSPVKSFATVNQVTGREVVVNVTLPGHPLGNGIVVREVVPNVNSLVNAKSVIVNYGEGNGSLQARGSWVAGPINNIWQGMRPLTEADIRAAEAFTMSLGW